MPDTLDLNDFSGGINNAVPATQLEANQVRQAQNVEFDLNSNLVTRPGLQVLNANSNLLSNYLTSPITLISSNISSTSTAVSAPNPTNWDQSILYKDISNTVLGKTTLDVSPESLTINTGNIYTVNCWVRSNSDNQQILIRLLVDDQNVGTIGFGVHTSVIDKTAGYNIIGYTAPSGTILNFGVLDVIQDTVDNTKYWYNVFFSTEINVTGEFSLDIFTSFSVITYDVNNDDTVFGSFDATLISTDGYIITGHAVLKGDHTNSILLHLSDSYIEPENTYATKKITSIHQYIDADKSRLLICTAGNKVFKYNESNRRLESITGTISLSNIDDNWYWVNYRGKAVGVNQSDTDDNPIQLSAITNNVEVLSVDAPKSKLCEVFNDRLWLVTLDNKIQCSALGNLEDYTSTGTAGAQLFDLPRTGDITGVKADKERLFIWTTEEIFYFLPDSNDNRDITKYQIKLLNSGIGSTTQGSIRTLIDDMVFLSPQGGVVSLQAVEKFGDFENSIISSTINELSTGACFDRTATSAIIPGKSQYLLCTCGPDSVEHSVTYVLDYSGLPQGRLGWTTFKGNLINGSVYNNYVDVNNETQLVIGSYYTENQGLAYLLIQDRSQFTDNNNTYNISIQTGAITFDNIRRINFHRLVYELELIVETLGLTFSYYFDQDEFKKETWKIVFDGEVFIGGRYGTAIYGTDLYASQTTLTRLSQRKIHSNSGRSGRNITLTLFNNEGEGFRLKSIKLIYQPTSFRKSG